jgi:hypothetical protein
MYRPQLWPWSTMESAVGRPADVEPERRVAWGCRGPWSHWTGVEIEWRIIGQDDATRRLLFLQSGWSEEQPEDVFG